MSVAIDLKKTRQTLTQALNAKEPQNPPLQTLIDQVLGGTIVTYKYMLVTALLAKATHPTVNPLALQATAPVRGAYDARNLCHKVLVPFERTHLHNALGGSNEPFLNKPARLPLISATNPTRSRNAQQLLAQMETGLPTLTKNQAFQALTYALKLLSAQASRSTAPKPTNVPTSSTFHQDVSSLLSVKRGGESLVLLVATALRCLYAQDSLVDVRVHHVNQSGASSREVLDIDVYRNSCLTGAWEIKDKVFYDTDVLHAAQKAQTAGLNAFGFIYGEETQNKSTANLDLDLQNMGMTVTLQPLQGWLPLVIVLTTEFTVSRFWLTVLSTVSEERFSKSTQDAVNDFLGVG